MLTAAAAEMKILIIFTHGFIDKPVDGKPHGEMGDEPSDDAGPRKGHPYQEESTQFRGPMGGVVKQIPPKHLLKCNAYQRQKQNTHQVFH